MYYHVIIQTKNKNTKDNVQYYAEYDINDKEKLIKSIYIPYIQDQRIYIEGAFLDPKDIDTLKIYKSDIDSNEIAWEGNARHNASSRDSGFLFLGIIPKSSFVSSLSTEITREIYNDAISLMNKQPNYLTKEIKLKNSNIQVFIVHGHDDGMKETVARFVEKMKLKAIILHEQVNNGKTIIEKFEEHSDVGFAIILYTPCDFGGKNDESSEKRPRARQNVVFEHGYFIGKLGRNRAIALHRSEVEIPSDLQGILYVPFDNTETWKYTLAKEMKYVGLNIDMNNI